MYTNMNIYCDRENKTVLVSLSDGTIRDEREKENVREWKILKQSSIYEYNIIHCTVSCWILKKHSYR
jgi:hypothetical protein